MPQSRTNRDWDRMHRSMKILASTNKCAAELHSYSNPRYSQIVAAEREIPVGIKHRAIDAAAIPVFRAGELPELRFG